MMPCYLCGRWQSRKWLNRQSQFPCGRSEALRAAEPPLQLLSAVPASSLDSILLLRPWASLPGLGLRHNLTLFTLKQKRELFVKETSTGVYQTSVVKRRHLPVQFSRSKHKLHSLSCQRMALFQNEMMYRISTKQPPRFLLLRRSRGWECTTRYKKFVLAIPTQIVSRILTH